MSSLLTYKDIGVYLIEKIPEFSGVYRNHIANNGGVLPHPLLDDFTKFVIDFYCKSKVDPQVIKILDKCLDFIEELFLSGDEQLENLACVSFLENLHQAGRQYYELRNLLRKKSLKQMEAIENWRP